MRKPRALLTTGVFVPALGLAAGASSGPTWPFGSLDSSANLGRARFSITVKARR